MQISMEDIKDKFAESYKIATYFGKSSPELVEEYKSLDPISETDQLKINSIPRILVLRPNDQAAQQFLKHYKNIFK